MEWIDDMWESAWSLSSKVGQHDVSKRDIKVVSIMRDNIHEKVKMAGVTDAKSLFDNLVREQTVVNEKRAGREIVVIRQSLDALSGICRAPY